MSRIFRWRSRYAELRSSASRQDIFLQSVISHHGRGLANAVAQNMCHVLLARKAACGGDIGQVERAAAKHVEDHCAVKRITRPMLGFKTFGCARILVAGIEVMHMIRKGRLGNIKDRVSSVANQFYSLAF